MLPTEGDAIRTASCIRWVGRCAASALATLAILGLTVVFSAGTSHQVAGQRTARFPQIPARATVHSRNPTWPPRPVRPVIRGAGMSRQRRASGRDVRHIASTVPGRPLWGVDVASYQHPDGAPIDWAKVAAAGFTFAAVKATEGNSYVNPYYFSDVAGARTVGMYVTAYHFALPDISSGASQARSFVAHSGYQAGTGILPSELDIEYNPSTAGNTCYGLTPAQMVLWVAAYDTEVQQLTGQPPIIFTSAYWWDLCTARSTAFGTQMLWAAADAPANPVASSPPLPAGWGTWALWRYTGGGHVPGIPGNVDLSEYNRDPVTLIDPGPQRGSQQARVALQIPSLNGASGQSLTYLARGLPGGLTISSSGRIAGAVSAAPGLYRVTITATNPLGATGTTTFPWLITGQPYLTGRYPLNRLG